MGKLSGKSTIKSFAATLIVLISLSLSGCSGNVGVGMSVGVPIGNHGFISVGSGWH